MKDYDLAAGMLWPGAPGRDNGVSTGLSPAAELGHLASPQ